VPAAEGKAHVQAAGCGSVECTTPPTIKWFEEMYNGAMSDDYKCYMVNEWGHEKRGDVPLFEKLCLEGAQAGLSWATILAKREVCMCMCVYARARLTHTHVAHSSTPGTSAAAGVYLTHMLLRDIDERSMALTWSAVLRCRVAISNHC